MFDDYAIATASRHPSSLPCRDMFGRSTTTMHHDATRAIPRHLSISQLSQQFSEQRLYQDAALCVRSEPSKACYANDTDSSPTSAYVGCAIPSKRRAKRQQGVRMLCDPSHLRSIQEMVERMVRSEDQCAVSAPQDIVVEDDGLPNPKEDEGYSSLEDDGRQGSTSSMSSSCSSSSSSSLFTTEVRYKRSSDPLSAGSTGVSKSVRIRKRRA